MYQSIKEGLIILFDALIFIILALVGGFLMNKIFPLPSIDETPLQNVLWLMLQLIVAAFYIYQVDRIYSSIVRRERNQYFTIILFNLIFFLVQGQIILRLLEFYKSAGVINTKKMFELRKEILFKRDTP